MNTQITTFEFDSNEVRIVEVNGESWFVLRDVLQAMGSSTRPAIAKTAIEEGLGMGYTQITPLVDSMGRPQEATIINEAAVTFLVSRSNTETGRRLNRWIHSEVLPAIRKTGSYTQPQHEPTQDLHTVNINAEWCKRVSYVAVMYEQFVTMFERAIGLSANQARISACRLLAKHTGVNVLEDSGTLLEAPYAESLFNPTDLGKQVGMSARQVNTAFTALGLQTSQRDAKGNIHYQPTEVGLRHGVMLDTDKRHHSGTPVLQLKWRSSVIPILQAWLQTEVSEDGDTGDYLLE